MSSELNSLDGNSWEADVKRWEFLKFPNDFQSVPATDRGDSGIEGYCISERSVCQCYSPLANIPTKDLYERQRRKLSEDIAKFICNASKLLKILPPGFKVRRYEFIVPEFRSAELVAHANNKAREVLAANLPYVDKEFAIMIRDKSCFAHQIKQEQQALLAKLHLDICDPAISEIDDWTAGNDSGVANLDRKIRIYTTSANPSDLRRQRDYWIKAKIRADNALEKLRSHSEELWEKLWGVKRARERLLEKEFGLTPGPGEKVRRIGDDVARDMVGRLPNLEPVDAETLADGLVGEWLQNCNLDFPESKKEI